MARRKNDYYPTPEGLTLALLDVFPEITTKTVVYEPCAGEHHMVRVLQQGGAMVLSADINRNPNGPVHSYILDATVGFPAGPQFHWVVTNPPFNVAEKIFLNIRKKGKAGVKDGIAFLLRLSWLEPVKSREFLKDDPPNTIIVLPRTSFTADGKTDSVTCAWMVWHEIEGANGVKVYTKKQLKELEEKWQNKNKMDKIFLKPVNVDLQKANQRIRQ